MPTPDDDLDKSIGNALDHCRKLIEAGGYFPGRRVRESLLALSRAVAVRLLAVRTGGGGGTWH